MKIEKTTCELPAELLAEMDNICEPLRELHSDIVTQFFTRMVDKASQEPTLDLNIGINIILKALRYYDKSERLSILKQTLEGLMQAAKLDMDGDFK